MDFVSAYKLNSFIQYLWSPLLTCVTAHSSRRWVCRGAVAPPHPTSLRAKIEKNGQHFLKNFLNSLINPTNLLHFEKMFSDDIFEF